MAEEKKILLSVQLDVKELKKRVIEASSEINKLVKEQSNIEKGSNAWKVNQEQIKLYTKQVTDANRAVAAQEVINKSNSGSLSEMRINLSALKVQYANLSKEQRDNVNVGGELQKQIFNLNEEVTKQEEGLGVGSRRVGQYKSEIAKLIGASPELSKALKGAEGAQLGLNQAFKANPLGFIIGLFLTFQTQISAFLKTITPLKNLMDDVSGAFSFFGDILSKTTDALGITANAFNDRAVKSLNLMGGALDSVTNKLDQQIKVQQALGKDTTDIELARQKAVEISSTAQINLLEKIKSKNGELTEDQKKQLEELTKANQEAVQEQEIIRAKSITKEREERDKENKKRVEEIKKAKEELSKIQLELLKTGSDLEIAQIKINAQKAIEEIKGNSEIEKNLRKAIIEKQNKDIEVVNQRVFEEQITKNKERILLGLDLELKELEAKGEETYKKKREIIEAQHELDLQNAGTDAVKLAEAIRVRDNKVDELTRQSAESNKQKIAADRFARLEGELAQLQVEGNTTIAKQIEIENERFKVQTDSAKLSADERFKIEQEHNLKIAQLQDDLLNETLNNNIKRIEVLSNLAQSFSALSEIFAADAEQNAEFQKAIALFQIGLDTAKAISSIVAASASTSITPFDLAIKISAGVATVLSNIAQAKKIFQQNPTPKRKAEKGIILGGKPHSQGGTEISIDGVPTIEAEKDELLAIVNKRSTNMLRGLSNLNQMGGGIPLVKNGGLVKMENGGIQSISRNIESSFNIDSAIRSALSNMPPIITVVQDINEMQGKVNRTKIRANI